MSEKELEKLANEYCEETGSMYFDYTDASNEIKDAFFAGYKAVQSQLEAKIKELEAERKGYNESLGTVHDQFDESRKLKYQLEAEKAKVKDFIAACSEITNAKYPKGILEGLMLVELLVEKHKQESGEK
jgi:hypothetical protein